MGMKTGMNVRIAVINLTLNWECVNCEETVDEGQNYCHNCGQRLVGWEG